MRIIKNGREMRILKNGREMKNWQVMKAFYEEGAEIEYQELGYQSWYPTDSPNWNWALKDYRIKEPLKTVPLGPDDYHGEPIRNRASYNIYMWNEFGIFLFKGDTHIPWVHLADNWEYYHEGEWKPMSRREG